MFITDSQLQGMPRWSAFTCFNGGAGPENEEEVKTSPEDQVGLWRNQLYKAQKVHSGWHNERGTDLSSGKETWVQASFRRDRFVWRTINSISLEGPQNAAITRWSALLPQLMCVLRTMVRPQHTWESQVSGLWYTARQMVEEGSIPSLTWPCSGTPMPFNCKKLLFTGVTTYWSENWVILTDGIWGLSF